MYEKVLIVDDDPNIREVLNVLLSSEGFEAVEAESGMRAMEIFEADSEGFDIILLDIMMPDMNGIEVCREIREKSSVPVLFLTAKSQDRDKVEAYTTGGDDFLVKPFSQTELLMKIKSIIRRHKVYDRQNSYSAYNINEMLTPGVIVDKRNRAVKKHGKIINLTEKEFDILIYFIEHKGSVVKNKDLYESVWGGNYTNSCGNTIMVHILNLRKKLEEDVSHPVIIKTVWGKGYRLD